MKIPNPLFKDKLRIEKIKQLCLVCLSIFVIAGCAAHNSNISTTTPTTKDNNLPTVIEKVRNSVILITSSLNENFQEKTFQRFFFEFRREAPDFF